MICPIGLTLPLLPPSEYWKPGPKIYPSAILYSDVFILRIIEYGEGQGHRGIWIMEDPEPHEAFLFNWLDVLVTMLGEVHRDCADVSPAVRSEHLLGPGV